MAGLPPRMAERAPELMASSAPLPPPPDAHRARRAGMNPTRSPESDTDGTYVNIPKYTPPVAVPINTDPQRLRCQRKFGKAVVLLGLVEQADH